jgi:TonB family protein
MMLVLDVVLDASAILLAALVLMPWLRKRSAALRHWVLATALVCATAAPLAELMLPSWDPPFQVALRELPPAIADGIRQVNAPRAATATGPDTRPVNALSFTSSNLPFVDVFVRLWAAGTAVMLMVLLAGLVRLTVLTRRARPVSDGPWVRFADRLREDYGIGRAVEVRESERPGLLLVWGWRRPVLLLPASARAWSHERIVSVLRHELAHVRRGDWLTQVVGEIVRAVHWFNPLVWVACARLHVECERACDDTVIEAGVGGSLYATQLLDIARDLRHGGWWTPAPAIVRTSTLERRVRAMLDGTVDRRPVSRRARHISIAVLLGLSITVASIAATQQFASLTGTIVDPTNGLLPGVTLVLTNDETKAKYEIQTDRTGRYQFVGLPPGTYGLETKLPGFSVFRGSVVVSGQNVQQDLMLSVGMLQETITITGGTPERISPEEQRVREERHVEIQRKVEEIRQKRATARCPATPTGAGPAIGGNIRVPVKLRDFKPRYPERLNGVDGLVVLNAVIGTDGNVNQVDIVSTTHQEFADSLIDAVKQWQFDATLLNCVAIETPMKITGNFYWK